MKLSVIILNYNVRYFLELCLQSVNAALEFIDSEIIVVDNNSSDNSVSMIRNTFPNVIVVENTENYGFSKGNNIGVDIAKGEYICILNPDTVVAEDTFKKLLKFAESKSNVGAIGCRLIDGRGKFLPESKRNIPTTLVSLKKIIGLDKDYYANNIKEHQNEIVEILVGAFMFSKKSTYLQVGGLDEDYFMYGEDIDLSYKYIKAGYQNYYFGETTILHFKGESTIKDKVYVKRFFGAMQIFYEKHFSRNLIYNFLVSVGVKIIPLIKFRKKTKLLKSELTILHSINDSLFKRCSNKYLNLKNKRLLETNPSQKVKHIIDLNNYKFKEVLNFMSLKSNELDVFFRFIPKECSYIVGSDSSDDRGEVVEI